MADDPKNQKELNKLKQEQLRLEKELADAKRRSNAVEQTSLDISESIVEALKENMGIKSKMTQGDSNLLKVNKDINRE